MITLKVDFAKKKEPKDKYYTFHTSELPSPVREAVQALPHGTQLFMRADDNLQIVGHTTRIDKSGKMRDVYLETLLPRTEYLRIKSIRFSIGDVEMFVMI
jgi:hypothetical protein